ncbi:hypothetical protein GCM10023185_14210 [Hymenobacter saemangeumensis]|uniref:Hint domain-containing protein n=1 Tax=Hymenobacter saemangeumensis TaxID=1084522 RepID=A0ABP8I8A2_9BACT
MFTLSRVVALLGLSMLSGTAALAQKPVKQDLMLLFDKVPAPLAAPDCAVKQAPASYNALRAQLATASQAIAQGRTATQTKDEATMRAVGNRMQADGVGNMSQAQQQAYAMQQLGNMPGVSPETAQLAQLMQDPAFQARLASMSDEQKALFLQQQLAPKGSSTQRMVGDPAFQAAQADFMQQMKNPSFAAAWNKKSTDEQDAYMKQLMQKHGLNEAKMKAIAGSNAGQQPLAPLVTTRAQEELSRLTDPANKLSAEAEWSQAKAQYLKEVETIQKQLNTKVYKAFTTCADQKDNYERHHKALEQRLAAAGRYLATTSSIWAKYRAQQKARLTPFNAELNRIQYGDAIKRPQEQQAMPTLAAGQQITILALQALVEYSEASYEVNKEYCSIKTELAKPFVCEENSCFPAQALVTLADGSKQAIASIKAGSLVQSYDARTGRISTTRVSAVQVHADHDYPLLRLRFATPAVLASTEDTVAPLLPATEVLATPNHPFLTADNDAVRADALSSTQAVPFTAAAGLEPAYLAERSSAGTATVVYNLKTEAGNYFVEGLLVGDK